MLIDGSLSNLIRPGHFLQKIRELVPFVYVKPFRFQLYIKVVTFLFVFCDFNCNIASFHFQKRKIICATNLCAEETNKTSNSCGTR